MGSPNLSCGKKIFATFGASQDFALLRRLQTRARGSDGFLVKIRGSLFRQYFGPSGWLALNFEAADVDWQEVAELMEGSYRQVALKRMLAALDER